MLPLLQCQLSLCWQTLSSLVVAGGHAFLGAMLVNQKRATGVAEEGGAHAPSAAAPAGGRGRAHSRDKGGYLANVLPLLFSLRHHLARMAYRRRVRRYRNRTHNGVRADICACACGRFTPSRCCDLAHLDLLCATYFARQNPLPQVSALPISGVFSQRTY